MLQQCGECCHSLWYQLSALPNWKRETKGPDDNYCSPISTFGPSCMELCIHSMPKNLEFLNHCLKFVGHKIKQGGNFYGEISYLLFQSIDLFSIKSSFSSARLFDIGSLSQLDFFLSLEYLGLNLMFTGEKIQYISAKNQVVKEIIGFTGHL